MDNRPIGFFDSGLGGLTTIPYLMDRLPEEKVIYFGDTARTPYGSKSEHTVKNYSRQIADFLVKQDVKMIVIACNTVSSICVDDLQALHPQVPVVGIIDPAAHYIANNCTAKNNVGIIGTKVTINNHAYANLVGALNKDVNIFELACPMFVPLIEEGIIENEIMDLTIRHYLDDFIKDNHIDTLVLGCTHYPIIRDMISEIYPDLAIINPCEIVISEIEKELEEKDAFAKGAPEENLFYASDLSDNFVAMIERISTGSKEKILFKNLDI